MTTVMYRVYKRALKESDIQEVKVTRKTDKSVWFISGLYGTERMERISSSYYRYFDNRDDAVAHINGNIRLENIKDNAERIRNAAPDLLEALEDALKTAKFERHPFRPWHKQAEDAIAKARGK